MRFPWVDRADGLLGAQPLGAAGMDPRRRAADVKDQMPLAMRMHVERTVQLIDRRATKPAMEDGKRSAHVFPSRGMFLFFSTSVDHPGREFKGLGQTDRGDIVAVRPRMRFQMRV